MLFVDGDRFDVVNVVGPNDHFVLQTTLMTFTTALWQSINMTFKHFTVNQILYVTSPEENNFKIDVVVVVNER
jgi:hypothetical protein